MQTATIFNHETVVLDGEHFADCEFQDCRMVFNGGEVPVFDNCRFNGCEWKFEDAAGRTLAYTGDTDLCDALTPLMTGADLVLADAAFVDGRDDTRGIHLSGSRAAEAAVRAGGVQRLMLTHMPSWNDPDVCCAQAAAVWPGEVEVAKPGATYVV